MNELLYRYIRMLVSKCVDVAMASITQFISFEHTASFCSLSKAKLKVHSPNSIVFFFIIWESIQCAACVQYVINGSIDLYVCVFWLFVFFDLLFIAAPHFCYAQSHPHFSLSFTSSYPFALPVLLVSVWSSLSLFHQFAATVVAIVCCLLLKLTMIEYY